MSDWRQHGPDFVGIEPYDDGRPIVVVRFRPADAEVLRDAWDELCRAWLELPPHPAILDAITRAGSELIVRFAAIDWNHGPVRLETDTQARVAASWGEELCEAMRCIEREVAPGERGWFLCPLVLLDVDGHVRLGFRPVSPHHREVGRFIAPEARARLPECNEGALVYVVGRALSELVEPQPAALAAGAASEAARLVSIVARCLDEDPARRYRSLRAVRSAFRRVGPAPRGVRSRDELAAWRRFEEDVGWQALRPRAGTMVPSPSPPAPPPPPPMPPVGRHLAWASDPRGRRAAQNTPARAEYQRGKELFAVGRLDDARACLERALALEPSLIEAMHLRREVDRCARAARDQAGHQDPVSQDIELALAKSAHLEAMLARVDGDDDGGTPR